jgi:adenylosuccinate lyase
LPASGGSLKERKMIERYTQEKMGRIWDDEYKFQKMLDVELAVCQTLSELKIIPQKDLNKIKKKARFNVAEIKKIEKQTRHDVAAFVKNVSSYVEEAGKYIHWGLTSSDVVDTAGALQLREASDVLIGDLKNLIKALKKKALKYKNTLCVGRTHGIHAEPTTFGLKMALFYEEAKRNLIRLEAAREIISVGKISGSVGTFSHLPPEVQNKTLKKLKLKPASISTQILQRDRHAQFVTTLALIGSSLEKIAYEIRSLQRTEIREAEEFFSRGQKGSSSMPHKRNPVRSERICGLARILRGYAQVSLENIALWHERDISHSSAERIILPDSAILLDYMLDEISDIIEHLVIYPEKMKKNLELSKGLIFSQRIMLYLIEEKGLTREEAYSLIQKSALESFNKDIPFKETLAKNKELFKLIKPEELDRFFDYKYYLRNVNKIFTNIGVKK